MALLEIFEVATALISGALGFAAILLCVPVLIFLIEVLAAALLPKRSGQHAPSSFRPSLTLLVPAHNEGAGILPTLADIRAQLRPDDRLLVVADNCADDTADVARSAGAEVIERHDEARRGKGYALDYGLRHLSTAPPEVVIMVDADCRLEAGALELLAERAYAENRPVQALYLMQAPEDSSVNDRVSEFTWLVKNLVRPLGLAKLGLPCQLVGTGMAFPWTALQSINLATGALTEDLKLGLDLGAKGYAPLFCPSAVVTSYFASSAQGRATQQERWEQGHRGLIASVAPGLLLSGLSRRDLAVVAMALDLAVPPIVLLGLMLLGLIVITALAAALGLSAAPFYLSFTAVIALALGIVVAWIAHGRNALPPRALVSIVPYVFSKLRQYLRILAGSRATTWVRTDRG